MMTKNDYLELKKNKTQHGNHQGLQYHLMPETGWLNDPNGLCEFKGFYHLYYQYAPFNPDGHGLKLWGHFTSKDFINYTQEEPVLFPDTSWDQEGVYSGSALIKDQTLHCFYTGNRKYSDKKDDDSLFGAREQNTIHVTSEDGYHFNKKELLLSASDYPEDMTAHVRDPKIYEKNKIYYMVLGARDNKDRGCVLVYKSLDLKNWDYHHRFQFKKTFGYMWECPDLFDLQGETFLLICPQGVLSQGIDYANVHQSIWMTCKGNLEEKDIKLSSPHQLDRGFDFYAPQTFKDTSGRRILIGWMGLPDSDYTNPTIKQGWQHALTIPRELGVYKGQLIQKPLLELEKLRQDLIKTSTGDLSQHHFSEIVFELILDFSKQDDFCLTLRFGVTLSYKNQLLSLDLGEFGSGRKTRHLKINELTRLQIFSDTSALEIFVNNGVEVFTSRVYTTKAQLKFKGSCLDNPVKIYRLKSFIFSN